MPHPGLVVATSPKFDGRLKGIALCCGDITRFFAQFMYMCFLHVGVVGHLFITAMWWPHLYIA